MNRSINRSGENGFFYYNLRAGEKTENISTIFPGWSPDNERIAIFSPHDDDALLGAGYLITAAMRTGAEVYVFVFCDGSGGYSRAEDKETIVETRALETARAYKKLGISEDHIIRMGYSDYSVLPYIGWKLPGGVSGSVTKTLDKMRKLRITRLLVPNGYREHVDHEAVHRIGRYDGPQVGDPVLVDWGDPSPIRSYLEYAVWGDFSPEDALIEGRDTSIRANRAIRAPGWVEEQVMSALREFKSQQSIIDGLVKARQQRAQGDGFIELYLEFDPRPSLPYDPYLELIRKIDKGE